ncbi:hypothetical protein Tco_1282138 [Tanacetum coccineum]
MVEGNVPAPTRTDDQLVPIKARLPIGKSNLLMDLQKKQKNPIFLISLDILQNTNLFGAFTASANAPSIYIQQFWNTLTMDTKTGIYSLQLDELWFTLNDDLLCSTLGITPKDPAHPFVAPPAGVLVIDFVNNLGYPEELQFVMTDPDTQLFKCCGGVVTGTNVDYVELIWEEFVQAIKTFFYDAASLKVPSKKSKPHVIPNCRFTKLIICYLGARHNIHKRPKSPLHITADDYTLGNLKFVPKGELDEVFGMAIPKDLLTNAICNAEYYQNYLEMAARKPRQPTALTDEESVKKKKVPPTDKIKKVAPAKQTKPVKEKSTNPKPARVKC